MCPRKIIANKRLLNDVQIDSQPFTLYDQHVYSPNCSPYISISVDKKNFWQSRVSLVGDDFLFSHDLNVCISGWSLVEKLDFTHYDPPVPPIYQRRRQHRDTCQGSVVPRVDNAIQQINHYPADELKKKQKTKNKKQKTKNKKKRCNERELFLG